jgi:hypothetical protein
LFLRFQLPHDLKLANSPVLIPLQSECPREIQMSLYQVRPQIYGSLQRQNSFVRFFFPQQNLPHQGVACGKRRIPVKSLLKQGARFLCG